MRRIRSTAARVALATGVLGGLTIAMAGSASAGPGGTITVSPSTFSTDETAGAGSASCLDGIVDIYIDGGIWIPNFPADGGGWGFSLVGSDIGVGEHSVDAACFNAQRELQFQYAAAPFTVTQGTGTTVEGVPTTIEEVPTTVEQVATTAASVTTTPSTVGPSVSTSVVGSESVTTVAAPTTVAGVLAARALPATGANEERSLAIAVGLLVVGGTAVILGRRRPADT